LTRPRQAGAASRPAGAEARSPGAAGGGSDRRVVGLGVCRHSQRWRTALQRAVAGVRLRGRADSPSCVPAAQSVLDLACPATLTSWCCRRPWTGRV